VAAHKGTGRLVLAPEDPLRAVPAAQLIHHLLRCGFIGGALATEGSYVVGPAFLQLVTFMGCSPHIELAPPPEGGSFCQVRVPGPTEHPRLLLGRNTRPPRCPACRARIDPWREHIAAWEATPDTPVMTCAFCGVSRAPVELGWRRDAGFARQYIAVEDVFPGEAVPVPALMQGLRRATDLGWDYFYLLDPA
jgi:hypothetical protein